MTNHAFKHMADAIAAAYDRNNDGRTRNISIWGDDERLQCVAALDVGEFGFRVASNVYVRGGLVLCDTVAHENCQGPRMWFQYPTTSNTGTALADLERVINDAIRHAANQ